jgi:septal ring factor EnvC (AmiA/AmiB activator)
LISPVIAKLEPGVAPDLGGLVSGAEDEAASLLAELALTDRPLSDVTDVINRLKVDAITRRIDELDRILNNLPEGEQEHSDKFAELVALQQQKKRLRSR